MTAHPTGELGRRHSYYRKLAVRVGIPPQFLDDAVHEMNKAVTLRGDDEPSHWKRTARFAAIDQLRFWLGQHKRHEVNAGPLSLTELDPRLDRAALSRRATAADPDPIDPIDEQDKRRAVGELLAVLPVREHAVLQLRLDGWKLLELAELFGISESLMSRTEKTAIRHLRWVLA